MTSNDSSTESNNDIIEVQEAEIITPESSAMPAGWTSLVPMVLIFVVFYFLLLRPQEKRRREKEKLVSGVRKGETILTNSGIFGTVSKINDDNTIEVEIAKDVHIKILKNAVIDITSRAKEVTPKKIVNIDNKKDKKVK